MSINHYAYPNINPRLDLNCKLLKANNIQADDLDCNNLTVSNNLIFDNLKVKDTTTDISLLYNIIPIIYGVTNTTSDTVETSDFDNFNLVTADRVQIDSGVFNITDTKSFLSYSSMTEVSTSITFTPTVNLQLPVVDDSDWRWNITAIERFSEIPSTSAKSTVYSLKANGAFTGTPTYNNSYLEFKITTGIPLTTLSKISSATGFAQSSFVSAQSQYALTDCIIDGQFIVIRYGTVQNNIYFPANIPIYFDFDINFVK